MTTESNTTTSGTTTKSATPTEFDATTTKLDASKKSGSSKEFGSTESRTTAIHACLQAALNPTYLVIEDESHRHVGHPGNQGGGGHFVVHIAAPIFAGKKLLECHRLIYQALGDAMGSSIHALRIDIVTDSSR